MRKLKNFAIAAAITASGLLVSGCYSGPQIDFGENPREVSMQMTEKNALYNSITEFLKTDSLVEKFSHASVYDNIKNLSDEEKQLNARLKDVIKGAFSKDYVSRQMPFTVETFNNRCDKLIFHFGNFSNDKVLGTTKYPDIYIRLDEDYYVGLVACTMIHEIGHGLGCQLESMTELFEKLYAGYESTQGLNLTRAHNKIGDITNLVNKYDIKIEVALKNKVGVKECFRAALTSPRAVKDLWNKNMGDIMEYKAIKKLNDKLITDAATTKAFNSLNIDDPNFTKDMFENDGNALLSKVLDLSEYNRNDPNIPLVFPKGLFDIDSQGIYYTFKVYAFDNPLLQEIQLKGKENLDHGGFMITRDLTKDYCKQGLNRYAELFNINTKSTDDTIESDIISDPAPPIELDR